LSNILFFSKKEFTVVLAVGLATGLANDPLGTLLFSAVSRVHSLVIFNDYLEYVTGGPVFGDLLQTWYQYGAVLVAYLVRKPTSATLALTINGFVQVFAYGTHDPHLFYGVAGLGTDIVFALFRFRRYDAAVVCLAGMAAAFFWYPVVWFTHGLYLYPPTFILSDLAVRIVGSAVGNGLLGAGLALLVLYALNLRSTAFGSRFSLPWGGSSVGSEPKKQVNLAGAAVVAFSLVLIAVTFFVPAASTFFVRIGPNIPPGNPLQEEYNLGYVIGVMLIFLVLTYLAFWNLRSRYSDRP